MRAGMWRGRAAVVVVLVVLAAACGGGDVTGGDDGDEALADVIRDEGLADVIRIDDGVDARTGDAADFASVSDPVPVTVGDTVRTDATGFAEIAYFDGSLTRLDIDTTVEVVALVDDPGGAEIRTSMGAGRTWHRVRGLAGDDVYEVQTSVATATVRGTAFIIDCPTSDTCTFTVVEGTLEVTLLDGTTITVESGQQITVTADGDTDGPHPTPASFADDPWLVRNTTLDLDQDFPELTPPGNGEAAADDCHQRDDGSVIVGAGLDALRPDGEGSVSEAATTLGLDPDEFFDVICGIRARIVGGDDAKAILDDLMVELASSVPENERTAILGGPPVRDDVYAYRPSPGASCDVVSSVFTLAFGTDLADRGPAALEDNYFDGVAYICDGPP